MSRAALYLFAVACLLHIAIPTVSAQEDSTVASPAPAPVPSPAPTVETSTPPDETDDSGYRLIQPEEILFSFIEFYEYDQLRQLQEQMLSIPGLNNFIPHLETPGLLTYQLRYSGSSELLMVALQELFGAQYELGIKEMGEKVWEITMRRSSQTSAASD